MAGWHSLAGYLQLRTPPHFGKILTKRKFWFVLDEERCALLYYKNENDAALRKNPLGRINVQGAGVALCLEDKNQFFIDSEGKKYILLANNHESMMIWLLALQAKRDAHSESTASMLSVNHTLAQKKDEDEERRRTESLPSDQEIQAIIRRVSLAENNATTLNRSKSLKLPRNNETRNNHTFNGIDYADNRVLLLKAAQSKSSQLRRRTYSLVKRSSSEINIDQVDKSISEKLSKALSMCHVTSKDDSNGVQDNNVDTLVSAERYPLQNNEEIYENGVLERDLQNSYSKGCVSNRVSELQQQSVFYQQKVNHLRMMNNNVLTKGSQSQDERSLLSIPVIEETGVNNYDKCSYSQRLSELEYDLMSTKCELAKVLNKESSYKNTLEENNVTILKLNEELNNMKRMLNIDGNHGTNFECHSKMEEKCRILQNQNRFLNEEVMKLSRMWQIEQMKHQQANQKLEEVERHLENLKRDYLFLLQSSITIANRDGPETIDLHLYGGSRHTERIKKLLEEARVVNPSLPTYEGMYKNVPHLDSLGFRHNYNSEGLILHYICRQLSQHYSNMLQTHELHQIAWKNYLRNNCTFLVSTKELKNLVRRGIPTYLRPQVWKMLVHTRIKELKKEKGPHYYNYLTSFAPESQILNTHRKQIALDLLRTMPCNVHFSSQNSDGVKKMQEVLQVFCVHNPTLGYCQGMNFIVGMSLLFMSAEDSFWCLVAVTEKYFTPHYFDQNLIGAQSDQEVMKEILKERLPKLAAHLESMEIELCTVTLNWFMAVFFDSVPFETLVRIWDCFLLEGPKVLFRFSLAILKMNETNLLEKSDTVSIMRQLKASAKLCYDFEGLTEMAFRGISNFPKRRDIAAKQACYLKILKEKVRKKQIEQEVMQEREKILMENEAASQDNMVVECGTVFEKDKIWVCYGKQNDSILIRVNCEENITYPLNIKFGSRIMCIHTVHDNLIIIGLLSHLIYAFNTRTKEELWSVRVNNTVLSLCSTLEHNSMRIYAALADGTIAVLEDIEQSMPEIMYILVGSSPVTCLQLIEEKLWCGCGNKIILLHSRSLDTIDQFQTTSNSLDHIMTINSSDHGVWITIRGSNVLELWDPVTLTCKLLFDVKNNKTSRIMREEDSDFNPCRITSVLSIKNFVWVGTANGYLIIYKVRSKLLRNNSQNQFLTMSCGNNAPLSEEAKKIVERCDSGCYVARSVTNSSSNSSRRNTIAGQIRTSTSSECTAEEIEKCSKDKEDFDLILSPLKEDINGSSESTTASSLNTSGCSSCTVKERPKLSLNISQSEENLLELSASKDFKPTPSRSLQNITSISEVFKKCNEVWKARLLRKDTAVVGMGGVTKAKSSQARPPMCRQSSLDARHRSTTRRLSIPASAKMLNPPEYLVQEKPLRKMISSDNLESSLKPKEAIDLNTELGQKSLVKSRWRINFKGRSVEINNLKNHESHRDIKTEVKQLSKDGVLKAKGGSNDRLNSCSESATGSLSHGSLDFDDVFVAYDTDEELKQFLKKSNSPNTDKETDDSAERDNFTREDYMESLESLTPCVIQSLCGKVCEQKVGLKNLTYDLSSDQSFPVLNHNGNFMTSRSELVSSPPCWSSLDEVMSVTTPPEVPSNDESVSYNDAKSVYKPVGVVGDSISDCASSISFSSCELPCAIDLIQLEKTKISDGSVKCLLEISQENDAFIVSCCGNLKEDEIIFKWSYKGDFWIKEPIQEVCPTSKSQKLHNGLSKLAKSRFLSNA